MNSKLVELSKLDKKEFLKILKKNKLDILKNIKEYLDDKYYNTGEESEFTDEQYDILKEIITNYDTNEKKKVGSKIREDNNRVKLPYWLGSLDKIKAEELNKLENWKKKNSEDEYIIENKLDGISCLLFYDNEKVKLYTRGDGIIGADITHLLEYIKNIPLLKNKISIRGELIMQDKIFKEKYSKDNSNGRNMVSGLVNAKSLRDGIEDVEFIAYEIILDEEKQCKPFTQLELLKKYGFTVVNYIIIKNDELSIDNLSGILIENKSKSIYDIDGIIIQPNKEYVRNKKDNPKYAVAFKMTISDNLIEAEVDDVEWNISKHKLLKPRIKIKPVNLNGVTITYASGFNAKYIVEKSIGKGSIIEITRSGDVIPFIVSVIKPSKEPDMPKVSYKWNENNVDIIVEEDEENIAEIKMISSFFSNMGIKNISDATVEKIYKGGYDTLIKIFKAKKDDFEKIEGFQKKLSEKIYTNIHNGLKNITKDVLLGSSGIFEGIGKRKLKVLFDNFPDILDVKLTDKEMLEKIINIEGFSDRTGEKIILNLNKAREFLEEVKPYVIYENKKQENTEKLKDITVLFSGFRNEELEKQIILNGGKVLTSVSKNLKILIVKDKENTSSKIEKARKLNIDILFEEEFVETYL
jgi:NAD-dependent DNA ligase